MNDVTRTSKELITAPENPTVEELIAFYGDSNFRSGVTVRVPYRATRQALEDLQERVNDLLAQLAEKIIGDGSDTPQFFRNKDGDIDFQPVSAPEPPQAPKEMFEAWLNAPAAGPAVSPDNPYTEWQTQHLYEAWKAAWNARAAHEPRAVNWADPAQRSFDAHLAATVENVIAAYQGDDEVLAARILDALRAEDLLREVCPAQPPLEVPKIVLERVPGGRPPIEHELKTWSEVFDGVLDGRKPFEARKFDRDYRVGDTLWLREWHRGGDGSYTGRECRRIVTYVLFGGQFGVAPDYVVMGLSQPPSDEVESLRFALRRIRDTCGNEDPHGGTRAADIAAAALLPTLTKSAEGQS